jgi:hypothetical protein
MKTIIAAMVCVVIDDEQDEAGQVLPCRNPLDDLTQRMRREMQSGRDTVKWGDVYESNVA